MENDVEWRRIAFRSFLNDEWFCRNAAEVVVKRGRGGACVPASAPRKGASIVSGAKRIGGNRLFAHGSASFAGGNMLFARGIVPFWYGNAAARTFGRAHRHRPYGIVWVDRV